VRPEDFIALLIISASYNWGFSRSPRTHR